MSQEVELSDLEYRILEILAKAGSPMTKEEIIQELKKQGIDIIRKH